MKLIELNDAAGGNITSLNKVLSVVEKGLGLSAKITKNDLEKLTEEELTELLQKCNKAVNDFEQIASKLKSVSNTVEKTLDDFKKTKKEVIQSKKMLDELNSSMEQSSEEKNTKIEDSKNIKKTHITSALLTFTLIAWSIMHCPSAVKITCKSSRQSFSLQES